jgi:kinesin family protein 4/21/27
MLIDSLRLVELTLDSKLRAHLEDTRSESRRQQEACKDHISDLERHRAQVNKLAEESQHGRASLQAANAQVATLKAQLDRAVEQKVQKRLLKVCRSLRGVVLMNQCF